MTQQVQAERSRLKDLALSDRLSAAAEREFRRLLQVQIDKHCPIILPNGTRVRGTVDIIRCMCGALRLNDGTKCHSCKQYYRESVAAEEENRL